MNYFIYLFLYYGSLPIIITIGLIVTYQDFKESKIRNKWIKRGLILGLFYYFVLLLITILGFFNLININYLSFDYYGYLILNSLIAFVLGFVLWNFKLWAGGDAKLFSLLVFLLPLSFYAEAYFPYWPALNLLINIFLPIALFLSLKMLVYPFQLLLRYIKNPTLFKEYYQKFKTKNQIDKAKIKEYIATGISFVIILVFFQLVRGRVHNFLDPYLGSLVTVSYFMLGFVVFKPLRKILKNREYIALIAIIIYLVSGYIYFKEYVYDDLHRIFALQMLFMMTYFYIFKYGKSLGQFLYNSTEINLLPVSEIKAGIYVNKTYLKQLLGSRFDFDNFKEGLTEKLDEDEKEELIDLINQKTDKTNIEKEQFKIVGLLRNLRPHALPRLVKQIYDHRKQKNYEKDLLEKVGEKISSDQKKQLDNILNNTDEIQVFLKSIRGKLKEDQAIELKQIIEIRNTEVIVQGHEPIQHIILHKTFAFAPFMFLGLIITVLTKSNLIHLIYQYILHR